MSSLSGGKLHSGPASLTFANGSITHVTELEIRFQPKTATAPDLQDGHGTLAVTCPEKSIAVGVKTLAMSRDAFSWASGFNGNTYEIGNAKVLRLDHSIRTLPTGSVVVAFTRDDGTAMRLFIKKAIAVPGEAATRLMKGQFSEFAFALLEVDPGDGTALGGTFEEGDIG